MRNSGVRFPRIRGDVPQYVPTSLASSSFSPHTRGCSSSGVPDPGGPQIFPHTRGCSSRSNVQLLAQKVFPAYAGMFRRRQNRSACNRSFPRIRGDVPWQRKPTPSATRFSPHTRGCSPHRQGRGRVPAVFSAYAGMFRTLAPTHSSPKSFLRIRGDVPPAWALRLPQLSVFPAYAGMFLAFGC